MKDERIDACVDAVRRGDLARFEEIVRLTQDRLRAFVLHSCPFADAADDVAQETYLYAYKHLDDYATGTDFFAWLRSLARHRVLLQIRKSTAAARRGALDPLEYSAYRARTTSRESGSLRESRMKPVSLSKL